MSVRRRCAGVGRLRSAKPSFGELRPELPREDHIAFGAEELRELLGRFVAAGAQKFVVIPIARKLSAWLPELWAEAVEPIETNPEGVGRGEG